MGTRTNARRQLLTSISYVSRCLGLPALLVAIAMTLSCGSSSIERPAASVSDERSQAQVRSLTYLFDVRVGAPAALGSRVAEAIENALVGDGIHLVKQPSVVHDAMLRVHVTMQEERPLIKVYVNGRPRRSFQVTATISAETADRVLEHVATQFSTTGDVTSENVQALVAGLNQSRSVASLAAMKTRNEAQAVAAEKVAADNEAKQQAEQRRVEEETAWTDAQPNACKMPATLEACRTVQLYLVKYPGGSHANEAKRVFDQAQDKLELLQKDENHWQQSGAATCESHASKDACDGVEIYLAKYPVGLHADEAKTLLSNRPNH